MQEPETKLHIVDALNNTEESQVCFFSYQNSSASVQNGPGLKSRFFVLKHMKHSYFKRTFFNGEAVTKNHYISKLVRIHLALQLLSGGRGGMIVDMHNIYPCKR